MLPPAHRLTRPADFRRTIRSGRQARRRTVVVYGRVDPEAVQTQPRVGITVSKAVGGSIVRHRVARVLRHQLRPLLAQAPLGSSWVVRALPAAGHGNGQGKGPREVGREVSRDLESAFMEVLSAVEVRS